MDAWDKNHVGLLPIAEIFDGSYGKSYGGASVNGVKASQKMLAKINVVKC